MMLLARYLDLCGVHRAISHGIGLKVQPKQDDLLQQQLQENNGALGPIFHSSFNGLMKECEILGSIRVGVHWTPIVFANCQRDSVDPFFSQIGLYCNHEEEAASSSDEEMVDGDANIDDEEIVDEDANINVEEMVDAKIDDKEMVDANMLILTTKK
ncbi:hypothetical protein Sjap_022096 [Stephania japonica]|uniref:E3 UFM1-protein ligase 1-like N-terminal domain-containing protein n=1 Tax=Stephania japonica TaxID=461633 RepID=A0AAP0HSG6_9MAGN